MVDGSVKEKCRQGFHQGGKSSPGDARYRYVLQCSVIGPAGTLFPLMHKEMDVQNPQTEKEDCELQSFQRLSQRLQQEFPRLPICLVADALYACQPIVVICQRFDWKYVLTLKEGRQPTTWDETLRLLPLNRSNRLRCRLDRTAKGAYRTSAGSKTSGWASTRLTSFCQAKSPPKRQPFTPTSPISPIFRPHAWPWWLIAAGGKGT